jgi:mRNA interferase HigB
MRVISLKRLREGWALHADAEGPLRNWYRIALKAEWGSLQDTRRTFPHANGVRQPGQGTLTVFNIGGNSYRLITRIRYEYALVNVRAVLTHDEYDAGRWKE